MSQHKIEITDDTNFLVKKDRDLVHKAKYSLSLNSMKYLASLLCMIRADDIDFKVYHTNAKEMSELVQSQINIPKLRAIANELTNLKIPFIDNKGREVGFFTVFDSVRYDYDTFSISAIFGKTAKPYLLEFKNGYLQYGIENILSLKSPIVIRLYEICKDKLTQYKVEPESITFNMTIDEFRKKFYIPDSYKYAHIKKRYLDKAVKQFKELTDIKIDIKENKKSRSVHSLDITVVRIKEEHKKKPSNFKPYLQFRDWLLENIPLNENYCYNYEDGKWSYELSDEYIAIIDEFNNTIILADGSERVIDTSESIEDVNYGWKAVFDDREEIMERLR